MVTPFMFELKGCFREMDGYSVHFIHPSGNEGVRATAHIRTKGD